tara:strand:+ start:603 stop:2261 length:1659 start_codon:yes stop_codon:yes gene_type:complete
MPAPGTHQIAKKILLGVLATSLYIIIARLSLQLTVSQSDLVPIWPLSGFAIAGLLIFGLRWWPVVMVGSTAITFITIFEERPDMSIVSITLISLAFGIWNTGEALLGRSLIKRYAGNLSCLNTARNLYRFVIFGAIIPPLFSTGAGVTTFALLGVLTEESVLVASVTWYLANVAGIITFGSMVIAFWNEDRTDWNPSRIAQVTIAGLLTGIISYNAHIGFSSTDTGGDPGTYLILPLLLWFSFRLGPIGASVSIIIISLIAMIDATHLRLSSDALNSALLHLQVFTSVMSVTCLAVVALISERNAATKQLERQVDERSSKLSSLLLEKDETMAIAAHDLRGPLVSMRNVLALLQAQNRTPAGSIETRLMADLKSTCTNLINLVSRMLDAHQAETLADRVHIEPIDIAPIIDEVVSIRFRSANFKSITVSTEGVIRPTVAKTDSHCFARVVSNLLENALVYSPEEGTIRITTSSFPDRIEVSVSNEGPEIPEAESELLFEKFKSIRSSPPTEHGVHGFGLYIVYKLMNVTRGSIRHETPPTGGCRFIATLLTP